MDFHLKKTCLIILSIFFTLQIHAQKVKLKDGIISVNNSNFLQYQTLSKGSELLVSLLKTGDQILLINYNTNETIGYDATDDDYIQIYFLDDNLKLESDVYVGSWKKILKWMYQHNVFNSNGSLNSKQVKLFIKHFHVAIKKNE